MNDFIKNFADIFDETPIELFSPDTDFKNLDEWSSLHVLATINMVELNYHVSLNVDELLSTKTLENLYNLICAKN
jgi:acyl carrier protein